MEGNPRDQVMNQYIKDIQCADETLTSLKDLWASETDSAKKEKLMGCINRGLDDRLKLMKLRDA